MEIFGTDFAAAIRQDFLDSWYSVDFPLVDRTIHIAEREHTFGSATYLPLIPAGGIGDVVSGIRRAAKTFDVQGLDIPILNTIEEALDNNRFSDFIDDAFESRIGVHVYLNVRDASGITSRELVFLGTASRPTAFNMMRGTVKIRPLSELYLNKPILQTITRQRFPNAPDNALGQPIRVVVGAPGPVPASMYYRTGGTTKYAVCASFPGNAVTTHGAVYWNGEEIGSASISNTPSDDDELFVGGDTTGNIKQSQGITVSGAGLLMRSLTIKGRRSGSPTADVDVTIVAGPAGEGEEIGRFSIPVGSFTTSNAVITHVLDEPLVLPPGAASLVFTSGTDDDVGYYVLRGTAASSYAGGDLYSWGSNTDAYYIWSYAGWGGGLPADLYFAVNAVGITKNNVNLGFGYLFGNLELDVEVPDGVSISAAYECDPANRNPATWAQFMLERAGTALGWIDTAGSFATSSALYTTDDYLDGVIDQVGTTYKAHLLQVAHESRAIFDWPVDQAMWKYIVDTPTVVETIGMADLLLESGSKVPAITVTRTDPMDVVNSLDVLFGRDWTIARGPEAYAESVHAEDSTSKLLPWGEKKPRDPADYFFDFIRNEDAAQNRADFYVDQLKFATDEVVFTTPITKLALEKDDCIAFDVA